MPRKSRRRDLDALVLLQRDHDVVRQLFRDHDQLRGRRHDPDRQGGIVGAICLVLTLHTQIEDEIFYPAVRAAWDLSGAAHPAVCGHGMGQALIARLDEMEPGDAGYDASVALLRACVVPHMDAEQDELFPWVRSAGLDTAALGRQLAQRQRELHDDVTRLGLPRAAAGTPCWPLACRLVMA